MSSFYQKDPVAGIGHRLAYTEKDSSATVHILNVLFSEFGLKESERVTLLALFGLRGNRRRFKASYRTIATQIEKLKPDESTEPEKFRTAQRIRRRIVAVISTQERLRIELIRFYPGGARRFDTNSDSGAIGYQHHSSEYELPFIALAMEAFKRAHADPAYGTHPGKALDKAAREAAVEALAQAQPQPKEQQPSNSGNRNRLTRAERGVDNAIKRIGEYVLDARLSGESGESIRVNCRYLLERLTRELTKFAAPTANSEQSRNDTYISDNHGGGCSMGVIPAQPAVEQQATDCARFEQDSAWSTPEPEKGINFDIAETTYFSPQVAENGIVVDSDLESALFESELAPALSKSREQTASEPEPAAQAREMVEAFESVGAEKFDTILTTMDRQQYLYEQPSAVAEFKSWLPAVLRKCEYEQLNFITRPRLPDGAETALIQLDDLDKAALDKVRAESLLVLETSPSNYQAWLALDRVDLGADSVEDTRRRLISALGADSGANGCVRLAGSLNVKPQYAPALPRVRLLETNFGLLASMSVLNSLLSEFDDTEKTGAQAPPCDNSSGLYLAGSDMVTRELPDYTRILERASITRANKPDVSRADFHFAALALKWGCSESAVTARLKVVSPKARARRDDYAERTVRSALRHAQQMT